MGLAFLIAVAFHAVFLFGFRPAARMKASPPIRTSGLVFSPMEHLPGLEGRRNALARAVYSPALFALPSTWGFSAAVLNQSLQMQPPVQSDEGDVQVIPFEERAFNPASSMISPVRGSTAAEILREELPLPKTDIALSPPAAGLRVRLAGNPGFSDRVPESWTAFPAEKTGDWELALQVRLKPDGRPESVLLLTPSRQDAVDRAAVRWAYTQDFLPSSTPSEGRLMVWQSAGVEEGAL